MKKLFVILFMGLALMSCSDNNNDPLTTEPTEISKYLGTWYEIGKFPNNFQKDLKCVTATYSKKWNGKVDVLNKGININTGKEVSARGEAEEVGDGKLKVTFFWPFAGDYYIIERGDNYEYSLVGSPSREFLWILSREKELDQSVVDELLDIAASKGFDISKMTYTKQDC